jgi:hypothetical protein
LDLWAVVQGAAYEIRRQSTSTMGRNKKEKNPKIKLAHPDLSGPDPSQETLLDIAEKRGLLKKQQAAEGGLDESGEPLVGRIGESILWSISLTMLHFTLDVLVSHQYAVDIKWPALITRGVQAFPSKLPKITSKINTDSSSHSPPLLLLPSSSLTIDPSSHTPSANTTHPPPNILLHRQYYCRKLPDIHHERAWILCSHEAGTSSRLPLDLVRDRT